MVVVDLFIWTERKLKLRKRCRTIVCFQFELKSLIRRKRNVKKDCLLSFFVGLIDLNTCFIPIDFSDQKEILRVGFIEPISTSEMSKVQRKRIAVDKNEKQREEQTERRHFDDDD